MLEGNCFGPMEIDKFAKSSLIIKVIHPWKETALNLIPMIASFCQYMPCIQTMLCSMNQADVFVLSTSLPGNSLIPIECR